MKTALEALIELLDFIEAGGHTTGEKLEAERKAREVADYWKGKELPFISHDDMVCKLQQEHAPDKPDANSGQNKNATLN